MEIKFESKGMTKKRIKLLKNLDLPENTKFSLEHYIEQLELYTKQATQLQSRAHAMVMKSKYINDYKIINTNPGIGPVVAGCFVLKLVISKDSLQEKS